MPSPPATGRGNGNSIFLWCCKAIGLFAVSKWLTRERLRILCYHGFSVEDENAFRPYLFMKSELFEMRMDYLSRNKFPVLRLEAALTGIADGTLPPHAVSITIDDGFYSVLKVAAPILVKRNFPATFYVTTYYMKKQVPIFGLLIAYILWKVRDGLVADFSQVGVPSLANANSVTLNDSEKERIGDVIRSYGEGHCDEPGRQAIARNLAQCFGMEYEHIVESRILSLITLAEAMALEELGISVHLHTHRHVFPTEAEQAMRELEENRETLEEALESKPYHFCYPSGDWSPVHWPTLEKLQIESATTCDSRLVTRRTHRYALPRILDDIRVSQIEFEAELCGFMDLTRDLRTSLAKLRQGGPLAMLHRDADVKRA